MLKMILSMLSRFALWSVERGLPLDEPADILITPLLARFSEERMGHYTPSSYQIRLMVMRLIVNRVGDPDPRYPRPAKNKNYLDQRRVYGLSEQIAFVSSCSTRNTEWQRSNYRVYLGLGFGAGLTCREINTVRRQHIVEADGHWAVNVPGDDERTVPIRRDWTPLLLEGLETRRPDDFAILGYRHKGQPERLPTQMRLAAPAQPHATPTGMRSTWIVEHLTRGLRPDVVADLAGIEKIESLRIYIHRMPGYKLDDHIEQIVGGDV
ncbi:site-specific recombinase, phage integrase family [Leifsonia aquatica ATCC 14665]|nr:site-specific recombinase, phage integrase family [Leifsonia aquatica ATCC 14665]